MYDHIVLNFAEKPNQVTCEVCGWFENLPDLSQTNSFQQILDMVDKALEQHRCCRKERRSHG
jgi:hypothetical protein